MDDQINEIEYIEKVITTLKSKYSLDTNKVSSSCWLVWTAACHYQPFYSGSLDIQAVLAAEAACSADLPWN